MIPQSEPQRKIWLYFLDLRLRYAIVVSLLGLVLGETWLGKCLLLLGLSWLAGALILDRVRPSEHQLEQLLIQDIEPLVEKAQQGLDPREHEMRAPPLVLRGPVELARPALQRLARPRCGRDGRRRSPVNRVVILLPLEDHLGIYSCHRDSLDDINSQVSVEEHHYRDVVSLGLEKDVDATRDRSIGAGQVLSIELTSGRRISVPGSSETDIEKTVRAIQALMRDKR